MGFRVGHFSELKCAATPSFRICSVWVLFWELPLLSRLVCALVAHCVFFLGGGEPIDGDREVCERLENPLWAVYLSLCPF